MSASTAKGAVTFAGIVFVGALVIWSILNLTTAPTKIGQPIPVSGEPVTRLCDRAVEALLHSKELIEVERSAAIVHEIPCGIERRL